MLYWQCELVWMLNIIYTYVFTILAEQPENKSAYTPKMWHAWKWFMNALKIP